MSFDDPSMLRSEPIFFWAELIRIYVRKHEHPPDVQLLLEQGWI